MISQVCSRSVFGNLLEKSLLVVLQNNLTYSNGGVATIEEQADDVEAMVRRSKDEHLSANSNASIQQRPAALLGALKIQ